MYHGSTFESLVINHYKMFLIIIIYRLLLNPLLQLSSDLVHLTHVLLAKRPVLLVTLTFMLMT